MIKLHGTPDTSSSNTRRADTAAVAAGLAFPSLLTWLYFVALSGSKPAVQQTAYAVGKTIQFVFPLIWVVGVRRQWPLVRTIKSAGLVEGLSFGVLVFLTIAIAYHVWLGPAGLLAAAGEEISRKVTGFGIHGLAGYAAMAIFYSGLHSFLEEYYWRWFVFGQLRRLVRPVTAMLVSGLAFSAHHVIVLSVYFGWTSPATVGFSLAVAIGGAYWAWLYQRSRSLLGPWLSHLLIDAAIFAVGWELVRQPLL
jgi:uncharacterized protein